MAPLHAALAARAAEIRCTIRDLSTTLSLAVVGQDLAHVIQVGDSACVLRCDGEWKVPVWPMNGEYANLTYSVTGFPKVPVGFATICGAVTHIAAFSDGLADLVLDRPSRSAFAPFFEGLFGGAQLVAPCGRNRAVTADLAGYLDSASARERSEDDKTLILAARV